jgi:membrane associated rhomboid family serine protease
MSRFPPPVRDVSHSDDDGADERPVRTTPHRAAAEEWALVLASEGLAASIRHTGSGFAVSVPAAHLEAATTALETYERENVAGGAPGATVRDELRDSHLLAAATVSLALLGFFSVTGPRGPSVFWFQVGSADSAEILRGELWRSVTALCLHADLGHVVANALFGGLFLTAVCSGFGIGFGLALSVLAGAAGNLANALFQGPDHVSVGASTAVFGAVGLLAGRGLAQRLRRGEQRFGIWVPIAAGLALVAMLGTGERTDIWAHLFGFVAGGLLGVPATIAFRPRPGVAAQYALAAAALGLVLWCWRLALA